MDALIKFLLDNRETLGQKLQNAPERWLFITSQLPSEFSQLTQDFGILLIENTKGEWEVIL